MSELRILRDSLRNKKKDETITISDLEAIITGAIEMREAGARCGNKKCPICRGSHG